MKKYFVGISLEIIYNLSVQHAFFLQHGSVLNVVYV